MSEERITNIFSAIRNTIQIDHLSFKKIKDDFEKYNLDDEFLTDIFYEIHKILDNLKHIPKTELKKYLSLKLKEIYQNDLEKLNLIFERRQPIFIPHNGHKFMRNRKMNLRSIYEYAILAYLADFFFPNSMNNPAMGGLPISKIKENLNTSIYHDDSVMIFDIFSCFENVSGKDIARFLTANSKKLRSYGLVYALQILDTDLPMYMDNEFDKMFVSQFIANLTNKFKLEEKTEDIINAEIMIGVDEIVFYFKDRAFTGTELHSFEKKLNKSVVANSNGKLQLNKTKSKLVNKDNIDDFVKDIIQDYAEYKQFGKFLSSFCYDYPALSSEEILLKIKSNPTLFKHLIREFDDTKPDKFVYEAFKQSYKNVFKGVVYNDLQLFFERRILGLEKTY